VTGPDGEKTSGFLLVTTCHRVWNLAGRGLSKVEPMKLGDSSKLQEGPGHRGGVGGMESATERGLSPGKNLPGLEYILENAIYTSPPYANFGVQPHRI